MTAIEIVVLVIVGAVLTTIAVKMERRRQTIIADALAKQVAVHVCYNTVRDTIFAIKEKYDIQDDPDVMLGHVKAYVRTKMTESGDALL
jgi:hypothetical protein